MRDADQRSEPPRSGRVRAPDAPSPRAPRDVHDGHRQRRRSSRPFGPRQVECPKSGAKPVSGSLGRAQAEVESACREVSISLFLAFLRRRGIGVACRTTSYTLAVATTAGASATAGGLFFCRMVLTHGVQPTVSRSKRPICTWVFLTTVVCPPSSRFVSIP